MRVARLLLLALAVAAPVAAADESYAIRLSRPKKVGDRYRLEARGMHRERQRLTVGAAQVRDENKDVAVHLVAAATVLAVDSKSSAIRIEYRIETLRRSSAGGAEEEVLAAGRTVVAEAKNGQTTFTTDGAPLTPETIEALKVVISAHTPESPTDDDIFGTSDRKRVGDAWSIHAETAARDLGKSGLSVAPEDLVGSVRLNAVRDVGGVKALEISGNLRSDQIRDAAPAQGIRVEKTLLEGDFSGLVPADPQSRVAFSEKLRMRFSAQMGGQKPDTGEKITVDVSMEMSLENSYSPNR